MMPLFLRYYWTILMKSLTDLYPSNGLHDVDISDFEDMCFLYFMSPYLKRQRSVLVIKTKYRH
uniref:Putative ovule protein n=1 Tax=Solanum chacoense TaxID=4108 RepID=A0A0V0HFQ1_SOLCH